MKSFLTLDSNATEMFKAQKGGKDIIKIVHVTSVVEPYFTLLKLYFHEAAKILFIFRLTMPLRCKLYWF